MRPLFLALVAGSLLSVPAAPQQKRVSPHEQAAATIGGKKITIDYGRPYMKGRKIFGGLEKYGAVWRAGADEATLLTTEADLAVGNLTVPQGSYALFILLNEGGWTLIINTVAKQWGAFSYDQSKDLGRVPMKTTPAAKPLEQFTISIEAPGGNKGVLKLAWENTVAVVDFTVR